MNATEIIAFRDLTGLVKWFRVALGAFFIAAILGAFADWQEIDLLHRVQNGVDDVDDAVIDSVTTFGLIAAGCKLMTYLAAAFLFARWTYLTKKNTFALDASGIEFSPGWSVGFYFVPVVGLWKPYQALRETFKASHPDFRRVGSSLLIRVCSRGGGAPGLSMVF